MSLTIRLTPRAQRDGLDAVACLADGRSVLQARVRAVPEDGRANAALIRLLATELDLAPSRIRLLEGATHRIKRFDIACDGDALMAALAARFDLQREDALPPGRSGPAAVSKSTLAPRPQNR